jgi:hypothetical protein
MGFWMGGVAYWLISLDHSFMHAHKEGQQDKWQEQLLEHTSMGWCLLAVWAGIC